MEEARQLDWYEDAQQPELILLPTGDQIKHEDPLAVMHALLSRVVVLDYRQANRIDGQPARTEMPNSYIARGESIRLANGIYYVSPRISLVRKQEA